MKTIPLKTLLGQITPLNWKPSYFGWKRIRGGNKPVADCQSHEDAMYIIHACNHFPELVEAAIRICAHAVPSTKSNRASFEICPSDLGALRQALSSAETVQIED